MLLVYLLLCHFFILQVIIDIVIPIPIPNKIIPAGI